MDVVMYCLNIISMLSMQQIDKMNVTLSHPMRSGCQDVIIPFGWALTSPPAWQGSW